MTHRQISTSLMISATSNKAPHDERRPEGRLSSRNVNLLSCCLLPAVKAVTSGRLASPDRHPEEALYQQHRRHDPQKMSCDPSPKKSSTSKSASSHTIRLPVGVFALDDVSSTVTNDGSTLPAFAIAMRQ